MERTLVILKPDAVQRGLIGPILTRIEQRGFRIVAMKMMRISRELAERHYAEHKGRSFYEGLIAFITSAPVVVMVVEGPQAVRIIRQMMGKTNAADAAPGTIRGDFGLSNQRNLIHGSDSPESAAREIALYFTEEEILTYERPTDRWSY
jgi:nucleoside-diphosphate kinase